VNAGKDFLEIVDLRAVFGRQKQGDQQVLRAPRDVSAERFVPDEIRVLERIEKRLGIPCRIGIGDPVCLCHELDDAGVIRLKQRTIKVAGNDQSIGPGLAVQAEIKTGERRIIQYLLSPIVQSLDEAGRER